MNQAIPSSQLQDIENRAKELSGLGDLAQQDYKKEQEGILRGQSITYQNYGVRAFPLADTLARYDIPALIAEIRRLRNYSGI